MCLTMRPSSMPKLSLIILASGAKQLVVQEALLHSEEEGTGRKKGK